MQARPRAASGTRARSSGAKRACVHQHGGCGGPAARWASMAQPFGPPHSGQRVASMGAVGVFMRVVFCDTGTRQRAGETTMSQALTAPQLQELKHLLQSRRDELQAQMTQNRANLAPAENTAGSVSQDENGRLTNQTREVDTRLTALDADELARIDRALERMAEGSYGQCIECGCDIPFARLKAEPMTQHCVACKSRLEQKRAARG